MLGVIIMFSFFGCSSQNGTDNVDLEKHPVLSFNSFDGGGYAYTAILEDEGIVSYTSKRDYGKQKHEVIDGAAYNVIFTFTGLKSGTTSLKIEARSPIIQPEDYYYTITVDESLNVKITEKEAE